MSKEEEEKITTICDFEVLCRANQFKKASELLKDSIDTAIPREVITCFACELYLKYLVNFKKNKVQEINSDHAKTGHDLKELYNCIGDKEKEIIRDKMESGFENRLEKVKLNFQDLRYEFEHKNVTFSLGFLLEFMNVLSEICNI